MDVQINVDEAIAKITKNFAQLSEKEIHKGIISAINRSITFGNAEGKRQIRKVYNIDQGTLNSSFATKNANNSLLIGEIKASSQPISLIHFQPTFSFNKKSKTSYSKSGIGATKLTGKNNTYGKGVSVEIIKGNRKVIPYAFMIAGKKPVFARGKYESGGKYGFIKRNKRVNQTGIDKPLAKLVRISAYSSLVNEKVIPIAGGKISDKFIERVEHEFKYRLSKMQS